MTVPIGIPRSYAIKTTRFCAVLKQNTRFLRRRFLHNLQLLSDEHFPLYGIIDESMSDFIPFFKLIQQGSSHLTMHLLQVKIEVPGTSRLWQAAL